MFHILFVSEITSWFYIFKIFVFILFSEYLFLYEYKLLKDLKNLLQLVVFFNVGYWNEKKE